MCEQETPVSCEESLSLEPCSVHAQASECENGDVDIALAIARRRILPLLMILYVCAYVDRANVSFALRGGMGHDLHLTDAAYGAGSGMFHVGYSLLQVPSNIMLEIVGARYWLAFLVVAWGIISAATDLATGPLSFALLRFSLGVAEAGYVPGIIGGPLSALVLSLLDGAGGVAGWRWLFILQGLPVAAIGGFAVGHSLPDRPSTAWWLSEKQKLALEARLANDQRASVKSACAGGMAAFCDGTSWGLIMLLALPANMAIYGMMMWLPAIVRDALPPGTSEIWIGLTAMLPYFCALLGVACVGRYARSLLVAMSVKSVLFVAVLLFSGAFVLMVVPLPTDRAILQLVLLSGSTFLIWAWIPAFWTLANISLQPQLLAAGLAFINMGGHIGAIIGPYLYGAVEQRWGEAVGLRVLAAPSVVCSTLTIIAAIHVARRQRRTCNETRAQSRCGAVPVPGNAADDVDMELRETHEAVVLGRDRMRDRSWT